MSERERENERTREREKERKREREKEGKRERAKKRKREHERQRQRRATQPRLHSDTANCHECIVILGYMDDMYEDSGASSIISLKASARMPSSFGAATRSSV